MVTPSHHYDMACNCGGKPKAPTPTPPVPSGPKKKELKGLQPVRPAARAVAAPQQKTVDVSHMERVCRDGVRTCRSL